VDNPQIRTYDTDSSAIQDLALGDGVRLDAAMSSLTTLEEAADSGTPIKVVGDPLYYEPLAAAIDKKAPADPKPLADEVSKIIKEMHEDGTLTELSKKWYGVDLTKRQGA
jgi:polar amino acid transport system substrate-binding protein